MSRSVDERIVEMQFDNRQFESNVKTSMGTLEKLKQALNFDNAADGLDNLSRVTQTFKFNGITNALDSVKNRFSALGIVGMTVIQNLTNAALDFAKKVVTAIPAQIASGGWSRAMNLENAHFQLMGLVKDELQVKAVMEDVSYAVDGTAYGLDAAAKVASQLAASGLRAGDNMKNALRGISGVAAMTNSEYEDIGRIFATVAGNGRLMGDQLNQLAVRGINAAAILAEKFGVTEADLREMVSKGKIDFQTFANAMDEAFGEHAKDANKTFEGVLRNIKAALSRIGAEFATPFIQNAIEPLNRIREKINEIKVAISPLYKTFAQLAPIVSKVLNDNIANLKFGWLNNISKGVLNVFSSILMTLAPITQAFSDIFPPPTLHRVTDFAARFVALTEKMILSEHSAENLRHIFRGVFSVFDILGQAISAVIRSLQPLSDKYGQMFGNALALLGEFITYTANYIREHDLFVKAIDAGIAKIKDFLDLVKNFVNVIKENGVPVIEIFKEGIANVASVIKDALPSVAEFFDKFGKTSEGKLNPIVLIFKMLGVVVDNFFTLFEKGVSGAFKLIAKLKMGFAGLLVLINDFITGGDLGSSLKTSTFALVLYQFKNNLIQIRKILESFDVAKKFKNFVDQIQDVGIQLEKMFNAHYWIEIAEALLIFAAALKVISTIPSDKLLESTMAISTFLLEMYTGIQSLGSLNTTQMPKIASSVLAMSASVLILAAAAKKFSSIGFNEMMNGLLGVTITLAELTIVAHGLSFISDDLPKVSGALIGMSTAVLILSKAAKAFGSLSVPELVKGLSAVTILLGEFVLVALGLDKMKADLPKGAAGLVALATALLVLSKAVAVFGNMDLDVLIVGIPVVSILLAELALAGVALGNSKHILAAGVSMLAMAAALKVLTNVLEQIGSLTEGQLMYGLTTLFMLLLQIGTFAKIMGDGVGKFVAVSVAMTLFAAAMGVLASVIALFGNLRLETILKGIVGLSSTLLIFGTLAVLLAPFTAEMLLMAGAIALVGAGVGVASLGLAALAVAITTLGASASVIGSLIVDSLTSLGTGIGNLLINIVTVIGEKIAPIKDAAVRLFTAFIDAAKEVIPKIVSAVIEFVSAILTTIQEKIPEIAQKGLAIVKGFIEGITTGLPDVINAAVLFVVTFINGLADGIRNNTDLLIEAFNNLLDAVIGALVAWVGNFIDKGKEFIGGIINGLTDSDEDPVDVVDGIIDDMIGGIGGKIKDVIQAGEDFVNGFVTGLKNIKDTAIAKAAEFGGNIVAAFRSKDGLDEHSPSRAAAVCATDFAAGFTNQLAKEEGGTKRSVLDFVQNGILDPIKEKSGSVSELIDNMFAGSGKGIKEFASRYLGDLIPALDEGNEALEENGEKLGDTEKAVESFGDQVSKTTKGVKKDVDDTKKHFNNLSEVFVDFFQTNTEILADYAQRFHDINHDYLAGLGEIYGADLSDFMNPYIPDWDLQVAYDALTQLGAHFYLMSDDAKKAAEEAGVALSELQFGVEEVSGALAKARQEIVDNIKSQMDIFTEFERKTDMTADEILKNMQSQVNGVAEWSANLEKLARRGIDQGLLQHLAELGPKGFEYVNAFVQMSGDQLAQANNLFAQSMIVPEAAANQILSSYAFAGWNAVTGYTQGLSNGINASLSKGMELAVATLNGLTGKDGLDENSPSKKAEVAGENIDQGLINGINNKKVETVTSAHNLAVNSRDVVEKGLSHEIFKVVGMNLDTGLANGIYAGQSGPINAATNVAQRTLNAVQNILGIHSPSTVAHWMGENLMFGFSNGISDNAEVPVDAVRDMATMVLNALSSTEDILSSDDGLVISPVLDLTNVYAGAKEIGNVIGGQSVGLRGFGSVGTYSGAGSTTNNNATNTFNINITGGPNTSPRDIADEVINRLNTTLVRGKVVYA